MTHSSQRRTLLLAAASAPLFVTIGACSTPAKHPRSASAALTALEKRSGGRLGVAAFDTASGKHIGHRADERFPFCSTFKVVLSGAILAQSVRDPGLLARRVTWPQSEVVNYSPISGKHVADGMTVAELCGAALQYSDNTAANQLIRIVGGPAAVTAFAQSTGNAEFRLDRIETALNDALPGDPRDTSTPAAMARSLHTLALGDALPAAQREQLQTWMRGNTTGDKRIRAGVPDGWQVADKTGTGDYGTANDLALVWPPGRAPIVIAIYHTQPEANAKPRDDVLAEAARIVTMDFA
ncbi:class A beta-lactamase [Paraburkholderia sp.]|uniref:class A beta-lactamase n=1 Tax=Paraburkholderia sp. TaxID=1926495 RepID=UPI002390D7CB|nr:class A beta-lactamase [Paraburkholderia sp.]MDE1182579.1 class A beta-lactamase [Paraburkholderia sp.]